MTAEAQARRVLVTCALPYASGEIHLGHLLEHILGDVYVRFLRMTGADVAFLCATDAHGSTTDLKAQELGLEPEELVERFRRSHHEDIASFEVRYDEYYTTHSEETRKHAYAIFEAARARGLVYTKDVEGYFSEKDGRFLPDRWIRGTCPRCGALDQYGDSCEVCGATYRPTELIDPRSSISGDTLVRKPSTHYFFRLSAREAFLRAFVNTPDRMPETTRAFVNEWFESGLRDWDISRDAPYFGFLIPGETDKYFYVWLDAPVGYIGTTDKWATEHGRRVEDYWKDPATRIVHVIGKDIVYFHTLFWPALLDAAEYTLPARIHAHGFLTVGGEKMSKSRGTFINAQTYRKHLDPQYLRFYLASKLKPEPEDLDLNLGSWTDPDDPSTLDTRKAELVERVNAELVNKIANLASRVIPFLRTKLGNRLGKLPPEADAVAKRFEEQLKPAIERAYAGFDFATAVKLVAELAEAGNGYLQDAAPWKAMSGDPERARSICTLGANYVAVLAGLVKPIVPVWAARVEQALGIQPLTWGAIGFDLESRSLGDSNVDIRIERIDPDRVKAMVLESRETLAAPAPKTIKTETTVSENPAIPLVPAPAPAPTAPAPAAAEIRSTISIDDFSKIELKVGLVKSASLIEGADRLLRLEVDLGEERPRNIFAGIRKHYAPEALVGRRVVVVANLAPRKMKWGVSEGMVLAATDAASAAGAERVLVLDVDGDPAPAPGSSIK